MYRQGRPSPWDRSAARELELGNVVVCRHAVATEIGTAVETIEVEGLLGYVGC